MDLKKAISAGLLLLKSHVKGHTRRNKSGAVAQVKDYDTKRIKIALAADHSGGKQAWMGNTVTVATLFDKKGNVIGHCHDTPNAIASAMKHSGAASVRDGFGQPYSVSKDRLAAGGWMDVDKSGYRPLKPQAAAVVAPERKRVGPMDVLLMGTEVQIGNKRGIVQSHKVVNAHPSGKIVVHKVKITHKRKVLPGKNSRWDATEKPEVWEGNYSSLESLTKSHVKTHTRTSASGTTSQVREHEDSRKKKPAEPQPIKHGPKYAAYLQEGMNQHDEFYGSGISQAWQDYLDMPEDTAEQLSEKNSQIKSTLRFARRDSSTTKKEMEAITEEWERISTKEDTVREREKLGKAHVRQHQRRSQSGSVATVRAHERESARKTIIAHHNAVADIADAEGITQLEALSRMQTGAAKIGDERTIGLLGIVKKRIFAQNNNIEKILAEHYGVGVVAAPPEAVLWAAERIPDKVHAKKELAAANEIRRKHGRVPAYPHYGHFLF